jgi:hypothetical protein
VARGTWVVVAAVAALAIAAVVDALPRPAGNDRPDARPAAPSTSARIEARGVLYYTDELCRLRALRLPDVEPVDAPEWDECSFSLSRDGRTVLGAGVLWEPRGNKRAAGIGGLVYVVSDPGSWEYRFPGETPAYRPDGALTFVRNGQLVELTRSCRPRRNAPWCERVLLTSRDLFEPLGVDGAAVKDIAWMTRTRLVAVLTIGESEDLIAVYEGRRLVQTVKAPTGRLEEISVSPRGQYAAVRIDRPSGFVLIDGEARPFALMEVRRDNEGRPPFTGGRAIAWSPDEAWTAIARGNSVLLFRMGRESPDVVRIGIAARGLAWAGDDVRIPAPDHRRAEVRR